MENLLIVLVAIGGFVYKIYSNYKEEMEKAKKRKATMAPIPPVEIPKPKAARQKPTIPPPIPTPATSYKKLTKTVEKKEMSTFDFPEEVRRIREQKNQRIPPLALEVQEEEKAAPVEFDLRKAVIQSAILERPYK